MTILGPSIGVSVSGNHASRVFQVDKSVEATISGLTITDGLTSKNQGGSYAGYGAGLLNRGTVTLTHCTISANLASYDGGGLDNFGRYDSLTLTDCTVSGNSASVGGGIVNGFFDSLTLMGSTVSGNSAGEAGGLLNQNTATLTGSTVGGNSAKSLGGGVYSVDGTIDMTGCSISGNTASSGSGLFIDGPANLTDCTVNGNASGGGLENAGPSVLTMTKLHHSRQLAVRAG